MQTAPRRSLSALMLGAVGVVFGDIGTSPLYAVKETFGGIHPLPIDAPHVLGVLSLVIWAITLVVSFKYVILVMRADNRGEGGSLALLALLGRVIGQNSRFAWWVGMIGICAATLFYGDSMITPAISVLSAVEGLNVAVPHLEDYILPLSLVILIGLFLIQSHGSDVMGRLFGPVTLLWFVVLGVMGGYSIAETPKVLAAFNPYYALSFLFENGLNGFLALGAVVLAVTGAEALYADMGHFGKIPIRLAWYLVVMPALIINYLGQGALLLRQPEAIAHPFFHMVPDSLVLPLVGLATLATIIASQAVISGAFSLTRQAIQLGYLPRMRIIHTSQHEMGQIYIPLVNWALMIVVVALVIGFGSSSRLASAYGVAVTGNMLITTLLLAIAMLFLWKWSVRKVVAVTGVLLTIDLGFFAANAVKIPDGGWFPLLAASILFLILTTWKMGRRLLLESIGRHALPIEDFIVTLSDRIVRVPGIAVFLTGTGQGVPLALLHNLKHNKVLHERVVLLTVVVDEVPVVSFENRLESSMLAPWLHRIVLHYGFMETPDIPKALAQAKISDLGFFYEPLSISYFLSRETVIPTPKPGMRLWREHFFAWMARTAESAMDFFRLPRNRVIELGGQVEI